MDVECQLPRIRVSITIDRKFLEWIDRKVEQLTFANRSHAFEYAIKHLMEEEGKSTN